MQNNFLRGGLFRIRNSNCLEKVHLIHCFMLWNVFPKYIKKLLTKKNIFQAKGLDFAEELGKQSGVSVGMNV